MFLIHYIFIFNKKNQNLKFWLFRHFLPGSHLKCVQQKSCKNYSIKKGREHAAPLFKELDILPLDELIKLKRGTFMWKLDNNLLPQSNSGWFSLSNSVIRKRLNLSKYRIPNPRIEYTKRHNIYSATKLWNTEIPIQLKQSTSLKVFKKSYKNSLISSIWWCAFPSCIIQFYIPRFTCLNWKKHLRHTLFIYVLLHSGWLNESRWL